MTLSDDVIALVCKYILIYSVYPKSKQKLFSTQSCDHECIKEMAPLSNSEVNIHVWIAVKKQNIFSILNQ